MLQSNERIIRHKVGLLNLAEELGNVSKACQIMGLSRDTFYRYRDAVEEGGVEALLERNRRVPNRKNRVDLETENTVVAYAVECPAHGQVRVSNELRKRGVFVSASGVRSIWLRHDLANFKARLKALEAKIAEEGIILTEAQVQALEKKKLDDEAWGEIDTAHPGYLGSQDTFYVGTLKGVGRIYQQTYVDTYAKTAQAKLYTTKTRSPPPTCSTTRSCRSTSFTICRCCASSPTGEPSIADAPSVTITSCSWPSTTSNTPRQRSSHLRPTESVSGSTRPSCRSSIR